MHALYAQGDVVSLVSERFGPSVVAADGSIDRRALGAQALADPDGLGFLETVVFPRIADARAGWIRDRRAERRWPLLVVEVPLLFEAGLAGEFDAVLVVTASDAVRRARVAARGQDFAALAGRQWPEDRKVAAADRVYRNDGDLDALQAWVTEVFGQYAVPVPA